MIDLGRRSAGPEARRHLWIVNHYAARPGEAGQRHFSLAAAMRQHGWSTSILACSVQHYTGDQRMHGWRLQKTEEHDGVVFRWLRGPRYASNGVARILNMVGFAVLVLLPRSTHRLARPDAVIGSTVHPLAALAASRLARRHRVPFIFEIRDLWPETLIELGSLPRHGVVARLMRRLERHLCDRATTVITTMPFAADYLEEQGVDRGKVRWISNGVWVDEFSSVVTEKGEDNDEGLSFVYLGALGHANAVDQLITGFVAADLPSSATLSIIGAGPCRKDLIDLVDELDAGGRIAIHEAVARTEVPALAGDADCLVVALRDSPLYRFGMSLNKLFEYMASGRPILCAGTARGNPLETSGGAIVTGADVEAIAVGLTRMVQLTPAERSSMGRCNQRFAREHFDFDHLGADLAQLLDAAVA
ncbi:glycosyltransferase family 4 protein [Nocardioides dubius]|uniref:Glycosyltransferase family 4 protein n=1 Tax=Nocardioides dubius TaxID=317019 RepID=A0ABP4EJ58_9ACTN